MATEWGKNNREASPENKVGETEEHEALLGKQRIRRSKSIHVGTVITEVNLNPKEKQALACRWLNTWL